MCPDGEERSFGSDSRAEALASVLLPFGELHKLFNRKDSLCEYEIARFSVLVREHATIAFATVLPESTHAQVARALLSHGGDA